MNHNILLIGGIVITVLFSAFVVWYVLRRKAIGTLKAYRDNFAKPGGSKSALNDYDHGANQLVEIFLIKPARFGVESIRAYHDEAVQSLYRALRNLEAETAAFREKVAKRVGTTDDEKLAAGAHLAKADREINALKRDLQVLRDMAPLPPRFPRQESPTPTFGDLMRNVHKVDPSQ